MGLSDPNLWRRLERFEVSPPDAVFSFAKRLARENRWSPGYTRAVFVEYRRFVYLCAVAGREMTPSDAVDQAWHLHLTYSRSYWREMCRDILGRPLHHEPTQGSAAERARFEDAYRATLAAYEREFDEPPPPAVWPEPERRFAAAPALQRIDLREHLVLDRLRLAKVLNLAAVVLLPLMLIACRLVEIDEAGWHPTASGVGLFALAVGVPATIAIQRAFLNPPCREPKRRGWFGWDSGCGDSSGCGGDGCSD